MSELNSNLRLHWQDHGHDLSRLFRDLCGTSELNDVTIACAGGVTFNAHKVILASASSYFRNIFNSINNNFGSKHSVIFLKDLDSSDMEYFLQFIYYGEVNVPAKELDRLIMNAKQLGIRGLNEMSSDKARANAGSESEQDLDEQPFEPLGEDSNSMTVPEEEPEQMESSGQEIKQIDLKVKVKPVVGGRRNLLDAKYPTLKRPAAKKLGQSHTDAILRSIKVEEQDTDYEPSADDEDHDLSNSRSPSKKPKQDTPYRADEGDNVLEFIQSIKGKLKVAFNGYTYQKRKENTNTITWICDDRDRHNCPGEIATDVACLTATAVHHHTHPAEHLKKEKLQVMNNLKARALQMKNHSPTVVLDNVLSGVPAEVIAALSSRETLLHNVSRYRRQHKQMLAKNKNSKPKFVGHEVQGEEEADSPQGIQFD